MTHRDVEPAFVVPIPVRQALVESAKERARSETVPHLQEAILTPRLFEHQGSCLVGAGRNAWKG